MATNNVVFPLKPQAVATSAVALATGRIQPYNTAGGSLAPLLPTLNSVPDDDYLIVERDSLDLSANSLTVTCAGSDVFATGTTTLLLTAPGERAQIQAATVGGTRVWKIVHHTLPTSSARRLFAAPTLGRVAANRTWTTPGPYWTTNTPGTSRSSHFAPAQLSDLQITWANFTSTPVFPFGEVDNTNAAALPVRAAVEYPAGTITPVFFNGARTGSLDNGGTLTCDPIGVDIPAGAQFWIRTYLNPVSGDRWPQTGNSTNNTEGEGFATGDLTAAGAGTIARSDSYLFRPVKVTGRSSFGRSYAIVGDSIATGQGDLIGTTAASPYHGFIARALNAANLPWTSIALPGERGDYFLPTGGHIRRLPLVTGSTVAICEYGVNDIQSAISPSPTVASVGTTLIGIWGLLVNRGMRVWQTTLTPNTTSTDGWATVANQTVSTARVESTRVALNTWLRAGAPVSAALAYAAVGTTGALLAGQAGHPLTGYIEIADLAESSRNTGLWQGPERAVTDGVMSSGSAALTSATAAFTSADVGKTITVVGAGASGALLQTTITGYTSATAVNLGTNASTAVSGAAVAINPFTIDGLHPAPRGHSLLSAGINTAIVQ